MRIEVETPKEAILCVVDAPSLHQADPEKLSAAKDLLLGLVKLSGGETLDLTSNDAKGVETLCKSISATLKSATPPFSQEMQRFIMGVVNFRSQLEERVKGIDFDRNLPKTIEDVFKDNGLKFEALDERLRSHIETSVIAFRRDCENIHDVNVIDFKEHLSIISGAALYGPARAIFINIHDKNPHSEEDVNEMAQTMFDIVRSVGDKLGYKLPPEKAYAYSQSWIDEFKHQYDVSRRS